ncbi:MAG TPA: VIT domain-containing protein [Pyrinomonadaceae bacterium]|nr:VIT domain-containing protein [Pyrinomonadaceae bacterium]
MRRRSILKWIGLTALSLAIVFMISTIVHDGTVAAVTQNDAVPGGSLQYLDKDGKPAECPLKHTEVKAQVSGFLSRVTVTQDFENTIENKIEAVYQFPLPQAAAVDDLTMLIGDRTVKGKIMRRNEAQQAYAAAKQSGKIASLLNQERPNIFTQQVANIMPGERVRIIISYVETLKYEDGSYEWSFPMVVAPRYIPAADPQQETPAPNADQETDASRITPTYTRLGMRAGHDISLEIDLDAGVPIVGVNSESHETEVQQINERRAVVRLKDRATIPNKDFLMTYRVAGDTINDAVLTHRSERGGFFTLILQPPQRVAAEDVMPKELVFVLDTSGSMSGFPLVKAVETAELALDNLYPHDTFNLITFSGDTSILFPEPVPATPENLREAKRFLQGYGNGGGGTEMMKAVKAALKPTEFQNHIRIVCFMTDGQVGNDQQILSEVKKYSNARVFAMGFGSSPNRYLLDKMAEYGRGEVDYISEAGDTSAVARRFNERIRNPLLTDISIDWFNLAVTDVYPKRIPDLFGVKPLILSGRYNGGGKGTIRLKGKMAGQDFVRDIPVDLPETEAQHDVLATLWGRRKIDDLMTEELGAGNQDVRDRKQEEIVAVGLDFRLMTQYTSFVAIDDIVSTTPEDPIRVQLPAGLIHSTVSGIVENVTVATGSATVTCAFGTQNCISTRTVQNLPIQGRSFTTLLTFTAGGTTAGPNTTNTSINGQRANSNSFVIDGVNANFGVAAGGENPGVSASGNLPALTASGGGNGIATFAAIQEVNIQTGPVQAEYGRVAGAQVEIITNSGTNEFHGSLFHFFGNDALDASDWFANSRGLKQPAKRLNSFGGTFGGPIRKDHTFFFASYEGMRLRQPLVGITDVPSLASRAGATAAMRPFLDLFPVPTGAARPDGFAEFAASFANPAQHDAGSFKIDHSLNAETTLRGSYHFADSEATQRGANGLSLNTTNRIQGRTQMITGSVSHTFSPTVVFDLRANYSRARVNGSYGLDNFGGAVVPDVSSPASSFTFDLNSRNAAWMFGDEQSNLQRQFNAAGSVQTVNDNHLWKFGSDYRRLSPSIALRASELNALFDGIDPAITGVATRVNLLRFGGPQNPVFHNLSLFAQDQWKQSPRLTLNYGVRWELAPPPDTDGQALAVDQVDDPATLNLATPNRSLWKTTFFNFAPRAGVAYQIAEATGRELLLRAGAGFTYDLGGDRSGDIFASSIPFVSGGSVFNSPFPFVAAPGSSDLPLLAFDPRLKVPYVINWNVSLQQNLGRQQTLSASYLGSSGKRLLYTETLLDQNPEFSFLRVTTNRGKSDYRALQLKFERPFANHFAALVSYTLSESNDNVADDSARRAVIRGFDLIPSNFDVRHQLTGFANYELPALFSRGLGNKLFRNWALDSIFNARSARPLKFVSMLPTSFGVAYREEDVSQRGFPLYQVDMALRRKFNFSERVGLQFQADAFNVLNHPNFEDPVENDLVVNHGLAFGQSTSMAGRSLAGGGFPSFYSFGGPRAMRFSLKLTF